MSYLYKRIKDTPGAVPYMSVSNGSVHQVNNGVLIYYRVAKHTSYPFPKETWTPHLPLEYFE